MTEDEMLGWHHRLDGHEFEQALAVGDGQGSLVSFSLLLTAAQPHSLSPLGLSH